ncbi:hypothetical protein MKW94_006247 [Papaver nudicaule]|uniref:RING-type E3 ubiquitin transferase n=1 Tax=Papaver nudicaule TaxID=74823 RepID=A0AA41W1X3_PAPNU|nr:hypothetical protein [Papaver nudicaule]
MAALKSKRYISADEEDRITRKIFQVTLRNSTEKASPYPNTNEIYLEKRAAILTGENKSLNLCEDLMETVLIDRCFSGEFDDAEPTFPYLIGCYRRAFEQEKQINILMNKQLEHDMTCIVRRAKSLAVSYCLMIHFLNYLRLPNSRVSSSNESPLVRLLFAKVSPRTSRDSLNCPPGFFTDILEKMDIYLLNLVLRSLYEDLSERVLKESLLSDSFQPPLAALIYLVESPYGAKALVNHPMWLPKGANGLKIEKTSILGPFFHVSLLSDDRFRHQQGDLVFTGTIKTYVNRLHDGLEKVLLSLLENADTQENVLRFIGEIIVKNSSMANLQFDPTCASLGMIVNLGAVMLRLFKTFLNKDTRREGEIDVRYVIYNTRLSLSKLTSLHSSLDEVIAWIFRNKVKRISGTTSSLKTEHTFFCEWFFMTARVLHLGLIKSLSELEQTYEELEEIDPYSLKQLVGAAAFPQRNLDAEQGLDEDFQLCWQKYCSYLYQVLLDKPLLQQALSFYQLVLTWIVDHVGGFKMPLPSTCPIEFACVPEHFVENAIDLLIAVFKYSKLLGGDMIPKMDEYMNFIIMFMANPTYIRNSYIRERMVELLNFCVSKRNLSCYTVTIFEDNQLCLTYLVRNLLMLCVEKEIAESPNPRKFRTNVLRILEFLWKIPTHCNAWRKIAEEDTGFYLVLLKILVDEIMSNLPQSDNEFNEIIPVGEQEDTEYGNKIGSNVSYVIKNVHILAVTSEKITAPFLLPQMVDSVVTMLNYFLFRLVNVHGKSSGRGRIQNNCLKVLLKEVVSIYVHLARGDRENIFPAAISKNSSQSYSQQVFMDATEIVQHEDNRVTQEFIELGAKVAALKVMDSDAALGDIPTEFLDPIEFTLMRDPVTLPSTKTVDRAVILRHLLNYKTDPFTALPLTQDMLIPNVELKAKLDMFLESKQSDGNGET